MFSEYTSPFHVPLHFLSSNFQIFVDLPAETVSSMKDGTCVYISTTYGSVVCRLDAHHFFSFECSTSILEGVNFCTAQAHLDIMPLR